MSCTGICNRVITSYSIHYTKLYDVLDFENFDEQELKRITTGACLALEGSLVESMGKGQHIEMQVTKFEILGECDPNVV